MVIQKVWRPLVRAAMAGCCLQSGVLQAAQEVLVDQNVRREPGIVLLQADMRDQALFFQHYALPAEVEVSRFGGRAQLASFDKQVIEGQWDNNWTLMLKFPSLQAAHDWYHSPGYQAVLPLRHAATAWGNMVFFPGVPESSLQWRVSEYQGLQLRLQHPQTLDSTPEYIVTLLPQWHALQVHARVEAGFPEVDATGASLSLDLRVPERLSRQALWITLSLRNAAGQRQVLGRVRTDRLPAAQWQTLKVARWPYPPLETASDSSGPQRINLQQTVAVELSLDGGLRDLPGAEPIDIRHLRLQRD